MGFESEKCHGNETALSAFVGDFEAKMTFVETSCDSICNFHVGIIDRLYL